MDDERKREYLTRFLNTRGTSSLQELVPVVSRWNEILASVPGLGSHRPGSHCRLSDLRDGLLTIEADHPAWLQLLQWNQVELLERVTRVFPTLGIRSLQLRLLRAGDVLERPNVVMPEPVKPDLSAEEQAQMAEILAQLDGMIHPDR